ncbi:tryptophan synthase subunit alpha [Wenzhouxiangella marina]|uniref:Tryptophan synthase alpha chain n=1 Tax=Wenzhouxiangella marina TaxID=1579979 RepID=A0A0K0XXI5_9GAMM|nr:tryptophan synthase subunit alpha [Wenzhouxiangella marina]AKS42409.1 Tryptophan synthase alpha chain [Wenzhouxiangella marina]MBB6085817.1 tryptophan synthase alpha chain [Wenzhouxiangella marina]
MNRIDQRFTDLKTRGRTALIPYVTAGHPSPEASVDILHAAVEAGADLLELGMPFSDVMADGPVIQNACARALDQGMNLDRVLEMVRRFRERDAETPLILMGYTNPIERRGITRFADEASEAGVDGLLIVDCPADEAAELRGELDARGLHQIFLIAPTTTERRLDRTAELAGGFVYYVSIKGVTGAASLDVDSLGPMVERVRAHAELPVCVGFGIREPEQAAAVARVADGVVIGSALVDRLDRCESVAQAVAVVKEYLAPVRQAMDNNGPIQDKAANAS